MTNSHDSERGFDETAPQVTHQVVVFGVPDDPHQLRDVIAEQVGINLADAQIQVHSLPGVLPAIMPTHEAAKCAAAIRALGVNATAIPSEEVPQLRQIPTVHHLRCCDDGLKVLDLRGQLDTLIAWKDVALISVGFVPHATRHEPGPVPTVAVPLATSHGGELSTTVQRDSLELLIIVTDPFRALRIDHARLNYEYLGDRMSTSATVNFRWLIQDLVNHANFASVTPATSSFLEHGLARHYQFKSAEEMQRYTIFHLIIRDSAWGPLGDDADQSSDSAHVKLPDD